MKILTIGPGESTQWMFGRGDLNIPDDIIILGMHRVFPHIKNVSLDYWTWGDPDASIEGLRCYEKSDMGELPNIILPSYFEDIELFNANAGTSPINHGGKNIISFYNNIVKKLKEENKLNIINNSFNTRILPITHEIYSNPQTRFNGESTYFGTVPFDGKHSESKWAQENKFTSLILPICHYLKATEVYCVGFDNMGTGIKRKIPQSHNNPTAIKEHLSKYSKWVQEWKEYHNMNIYSITPTSFTPNNSVMEYKSIEELGWIK
jgi:hypothetical protein